LLHQLLRMRESIIDFDNGSISEAKSRESVI
jgi:hypothetical protein